jgi:hypothetical protein
MAVQLQLPLESVEQVALDQPRGMTAPAPLLQSILVEETDRHAGANGNVMEPVVTVLSV